MPWRKPVNRPERVRDAKILKCSTAREHEQPKHIAKTTEPQREGAAGRRARDLRQVLVPFSIPWNFRQM